jgi:hypothetical protein
VVQSLGHRASPELRQGTHGRGVEDGGLGRSLCTPFSSVKEGRAYEEKLLQLCMLKEVGFQSAWRIGISLFVDGKGGWTYRDGVRLTPPLDRRTSQRSHLKAPQSPASDQSSAPIRILGEGRDTYEFTLTIQPRRTQLPPLLPILGRLQIYSRGHHVPNRGHVDHPGLVVGGGSCARDECREE